ncbi:MAG: Hin recombinase [Desulfobulbaceae bacterium]|nr:Hin recombinase [Desulfobulbaceae bacterium]
MDGIKKAKGWGVAFGRKKKLNKDGVAMLRQRRAEGVLIKTLMKDYNFSKASIYRYLGADVTLCDHWHSFWHFVATMMALRLKI